MEFRISFHQVIAVASLATVIASLGILIASLAIAKSQ